MPQKIQEALGIAEQGDEFDIITEDGEWIEIDYNNNNGYVKNRNMCSLNKIH